MNLRRIAAPAWRAHCARVDPTSTLLPPTLRLENAAAWQISNLDYHQHAPTTSGRPFPAFLHYEKCRVVRTKVLL